MHYVRLFLGNPITGVFNYEVTGTYIVTYYETAINETLTLFGAGRTLRAS